jgi:hypothetical protein
MVLEGCRFSALLGNVMTVRLMLALVQESLLVHITRRLFYVLHIQGGQVQYEASRVGAYI